MKLSFAVEPRETAYMLKQGFGHGRVRLFWSSVG